MKYKMVKEADKHFEIRHPKDGSVFKVAKSGLSEVHMAKIRSMAEGGEVDTPDGQEENGSIPTEAPSNLAALFNAQPDAPPDQSTIAPQESANLATPEELDQLAAKLPKAAPTEKAESPAEPALVNPNTVLSGAPSGMQLASYQSGPTATAASAMNALAADNDQIIGGQVKSLQAAGQAAAKASQEQAKLYGEQAQKMQALDEQTKVRYAALDQEQEQLKQDVASAKIDPTRLWNNASTGNKILAGIGVLLSGIGSGGTGPNLALQVIDKTIDQDIAAQRAELGKKEGLLAQNYRKYGDLHAATTATALHLNGVVQAQLAASAARAAGPQAQANMQAAIGQLQEKANQYKQQLALQGLKSDILNGGTPAPEGLPAALAENLFPGRTVNTPQGIKIAKTPEEAKEVGKALTSLQTIDKRLDDMLAFTKNVGSTAPFAMTANSAVGESLKNEVIQELGELNGLQRLTGEEVDLRKKQVPDPGAFHTSKAVAQIMTLKKFVKEKQHAEYANHLVGFNPGRGSERDVPVPGATTVSYTGGN